MGKSWVYRCFFRRNITGKCWENAGFFGTFMGELWKIIYWDLRFHLIVMRSPEPGYEMEVES